MATKKVNKKSKTAKPATFKRNGVTYAAVTPSTLTALKNRLKKALDAFNGRKELPKTIMAKNAPATIPGTTMSTFWVFAATENGVAGARNIGNDEYRVRVVPAEGKTLASISHWPKTPGADRKHYSTVVKEQGLYRAIAEATFALVVG